MRFVKKYFWILPCTFFLIFSGCGQEMKKEVNLEKNLDNEIVITKNDSRYEAHITGMPEGIASISFKSPENLENVTFEYKDGRYVVSNKELSGEYNLNPLEKDSIFSEIMDFLNAFGNGDNLKVDSRVGENTILKVNFEDKEYKVTTNKEGKITLIENPAENLKVEFVG